MAQGVSNGLPTFCRLRSCLLYLSAVCNAMQKMLLGPKTVQGEGKGMSPCWVEFELDVWCAESILVSCHQQRALLLAGQEHDERSGCQGCEPLSQQPLLDAVHAVPQRLVTSMDVFWMDGGCSATRLLCLLGAIGGFNSRCLRQSGSQWFTVA